MQPENMPSLATLGRAAFNEFKRCVQAESDTPPKQGEWDDLPEYARESWAAVSQAVLTAAGLHALAVDVMDENAAVSAGIVEVGSGKFMQDAKGNLIGLGQIKPQRILEDEMVRKVMRFARELSDQKAAQAEAQRLTRNTGEGHFQLARGRFDAQAEADVIAGSSFRTGIAGTWRSDAVDQVFDDNGWTTKVEVKSKEDGSSGKKKEE